MQAETQLEMPLDLNMLAKEVLMEVLRKRGFTQIRNEVNDMGASIRELKVSDLTSSLRLNTDIVLEAMVVMAQRLGKSND